MSARAAQFYKKTSASSGVLSATPHKLTSLSYQTLRQSLNRAIACIEAKELMGKINAIQKAQDVLGDLEASLNHEAGGDVAASLGQLYEYAIRRLVTANRTNDVNILREIDSLIEKIESSWNAIGESAAA